SFHFLMMLKIVFKLFLHSMLENNIDKVLNGRKGVRFFFPLCGKAVDMKWLNLYYSLTVL
uniref:Thiopurine S-methyltransferase n=1 Tax=Acanthochromis polyacanthus TaxID=80966 RepID=A0A3Q1GT66_9TELE